MWVVPLDSADPDGKQTADITTVVSRDHIAEWRRSLGALWLSVLAAILAVSMCFVFTPLFLATELGVHNRQELALWTGLCNAALGIGRAAMSPVWGVLADRIGRKPMLIRANLSSGATIALMFVAQKPIHVFFIYLFFGAVGGTVPVATALAAKETPRPKVGLAVGVVQSASALGQSLGPFAGSLAAIGVGLRGMYAVGAAIYATSAIPVVRFVRESKDSLVRSARESFRGAIRRAPPGTAAAMVYLFIANALLWTITTATQPLIALQVLRLDPSGAVLLTGLTFGVASFLTAVAAFTNYLVANRSGYRVLAVAMSIVGAAALFSIAMTSSVILLVIGVSLFGLTRGVLIPSIASMVGLEAPTHVQATAFGISVTAQGIGLAAGPLVAGGVAAVSSSSVGLIVASALSLALAALFLFWIREPAVHISTPAELPPSELVEIAVEGPLSGT